jgi:ElaB/YqjD/DUF883 family membrane-anchored ribosome-binding protein
MSSTVITSASEHTRQPAEELRRQMRTIRREMGEDLEEIVGQAERLLDWRYYVRQHPWKLVGVAACLGCFVAWRLSKRTPIQAKPLQHAQILQGRPQQQARPQQLERTKSVLLGSLLGLGGDMLLRAALNYTAEQMGKMLERRVAKDQPVGGESAFIGWPKESAADLREPIEPIPNQDMQRGREAVAACLRP